MFQKAVWIGAPLVVWSVVTYLVLQVVPLSILWHFGVVYSKFHSVGVTSVENWVAFAGCILFILLCSYAYEDSASKSDKSRTPAVLSFFVFAGGIIAFHLLLMALSFLFKRWSQPPSVIDILILPLLATSFYAIIRWTLWQKPSPITDPLRRGLEVLDNPRKAVNALARLFKRLGEPGVVIHPSLKLPFKHETKHVLLMAQPGGGKTQVIFPLLQSLIDRGDRVILYDFKGDYTAAFGERDDALLLTPFDERSVAWDIAADITTKALALEFAALLIPADAARQPFFPKAAQDLLVGAIVKLQQELPRTWTLQDLVSLIEEREALVAANTLYRPAAISSIGKLSGGQASGVFGELRTGTVLLENLAQAWTDAEHKLSITEWVDNDGKNGEPKIIILQGNRRYQQIDGFFTSLAFSLLFRQVLSLPDSYGRRLWAILDEFGNLPKIDGLDSTLTAIRSKGLRVVAAIQDIAQVETKYTPAFTRTFFNCFGTVLAGAASGPTASFLSEAFGKNQIEREIEGESTSKKGRNGGGKSKSKSHQVVIEPALLDTDFSLPLPDGDKVPATFWLRASGWPISKLQYPTKATPAHYPPNVAPEWFTKDPKIKIMAAPKPAPDAVKPDAPEAPQAPGDSPERPAHPGSDQSNDRKKEQEPELLSVMESDDDLDW